MNPVALKELFTTNPMAGIAGAQLFAIGVLFMMLVRSYNARIEASDRLASALTKMEILHEKTVILLERYTKRRRAPDVAQRPAGEGEAE
jgi:hypothetical protein